MRSLFGLGWMKIKDHEEMVIPKQERVDFSDVFTTDESPTEIDYDDRLSQFEELCSSFPRCFEYANSTWIIPCKENFVVAWIDRVMHLGNTTTNRYWYCLVRVESAHARLKRLLQDSRGNICNCWDAIHNLIILQHTKVNRMNVEHRFNNPLYDKLFGFVSKNAMGHIVEEMKQVKYIGIDKSTCGCILKSTHGLPYACQLAICKMYFRLTLHPELEELERGFDGLDVNGKVAFKYKVHELTFPNTTSMCPPPKKIRTRGSTRGQSRKEFI
ncbi:PKS-NRPS hybrid synthetase [Sesbania bispinosa]|nr:PKS-NRPS hybrid synthetase [Sesbania bispinosa]